MGGGGIRDGKPVETCETSGKRGIGSCPDGALARKGNWATTSSVKGGPGGTGRK